MSDLAEPHTPAAPTPTGFTLFVQTVLRSAIDSAAAAHAP